MSIRIRTFILAAVLVVGLVSGTIMSTAALDLGDIVKVGGVAFIADKFGGQINNFINTLTANKNAGTQEATNVVPIISLGDGGYIGAAQVIGTKANVDKTKVSFRSSLTLPSARLCV